MKLTKDVIVPAVCHILNLSIQQRKFPNKWKIAKISPLLKKGDPTQLKNYRPVALLCVAGMVLEKMVADQIESYFESNGLLGEYQFGFRRNKSTVSEMLTLYETLQEAKENSMHSLVILFDLSAAFDTVEPTVLIRKLKIYGFDQNSRSWMESYLTGRSQVATVNGQYSKSVELSKVGLCKYLDE